MRKVLIFSLMAAFCTTGFAQSDYSTAPAETVKPVRLGFLARPALTWLSAENEEIDSKGVRPGFSFGFLVDFTIAQNQNYAFSTGLLMNLADGGKLNYASSQVFGNDTISTQANTVSRINFQWLEIPLTLKLKTNQIGYMTYFGQLGLQGGVKLGAKRTGEHQQEPELSPVDPFEKENINDDTRLFNAGLLVCLGAEYNISGATNIIIGISYYRGFTNVLKGNVLQTNAKGDFILDENGDPSGSKRRATLSNISLNLGVIF